MQVSIDDDMPIVQSGTSGGTVSEANLDNLVGTSGSRGTNDSDPNPDGPAVTADGSISDLFSIGADQAGGYGFTSDQTVLDNWLTTLNLTSKGIAIDTVAVVSGVLTAYAGDGVAGVTAGDRPVFSLSLDPTSGAWTFTLIDQIDHTQPTNDTSQSIDFGGILGAGDFDGDHVALPAAGW